MGRRNNHDDIEKPTRMELYWIATGQAHVLAGGQAAFFGRIGGGNCEIEIGHFGI
ncbi:hypothetical protein [Glutamicibacter uratoxydans]|uniref:hypothetical protein n=1 Tax=Glutamicibacter uratoxydans TaxID=43667 RepID=UPI003D6E13B4